MKNSVPNYLSPVSIIPGGCPQFLDFALPEEAVRRLRLSFREEKKQNDTNPEAQSQQQPRYTHYLRCLTETEDGLVDQLTNLPCDEDYSVEARRALDALEGHWLPIPFLRTLDQLWPDGSKRFECGPSNWARARIIRSESHPGTLRVVILFDTNTEERPTEGEEYHALSPQDVTAHGHFMLAHRVRDNSWFLNAAWVDEWIYGLFDAWRQSQYRGHGSWTEESPYRLEHLAYYLTWLEVLHTSLNDVAVQVINPARDTPVEVDLVLDIGNSRTTGILVETLPQRITNLNDSYLLELRDLSKPEYIYDDPFDTRIEFVDAVFGNDALSRRSGRKTPAFAWPSAVRIGPEAARLATMAVCAEGATGMSSPKRYLWDERPWKQSWRYNMGGQPEPLVSRGLFPRQLNPHGTPRECFDDPLFKNTPALKTQKNEPVFESLFTRSSLMLFMLGEILTQTLVTINSPATRSRRELPHLPRRLRRLIFTIPTAMPVAEKRIFRRWVTWAVRVIWSALGWSQWYIPKPAFKEQSGDYRRSPRIQCDWDEASCSQLVLLYNELVVKHHGDAHHLFRLMGKARERYAKHPCVRMASIDIGGGTTDLSITTFELASGEGDTARIVPHTEFRDGFNIAGDEVLREVIVSHVIPAIGQALISQGLAQPRALLGQLFGRDAIGMSQEDRNTRIRLVREIAVPVALGLLSTCEDPQLRSLNQYCKLRDFFEPHPMEDAQIQSGDEEKANEETGFHFARLAIRPQASTLKAVEALVRRSASCIQNFSILDVPIQVNPKAVETTIRNTLGATLAAMCELVHMYDCDILLLTGRPSAWEGVTAAVLAKLPVPPDRIIPMRSYHAGAWYPFADAQGRITDPKTTVVVGAILCALADGHLEGFSFDSNALRLTSTARYIGELNIDSQLKKAKVWFTVDVDNNQGTEQSRQVAFTGPLSIGYRQLAAERWPTTRYHLLTFSDEAARNRATGRLPYDVEVRLYVEDVWDDMPAKDGTQEQRSEGEFRIDSIVDNQGRSVDRRDLEIRLQTLRLDEGYWLDTGIVSDAG
jgi:hypothetical protein